MTLLEFKTDPRLHTPPFMSKTWSYWRIFTVSFFSSFLLSLPILIFEIKYCEVLRVPSLGGRLGRLPRYDHWWLLMPKGDRYFGLASIPLPSHPLRPYHLIFLHFYYWPHPNIILFLFVVFYYRASHRSTYRALLTVTSPKSKTRSK